MRMKRYASNFAGVVQRIQVSRETSCSVSEEKAVHPNRKQVATVDSVMSGINMN